MTADVDRHSMDGVSVSMLLRGSVVIVVGTLTVALAPAVAATPAPQSQLVRTTAVWPAADGMASSTPTIIGTASVGKQLAVRPGIWAVGATLTFQWFSSGVAVTGAHASKLLLTPAMLGKRITVSVTGSLAGYAAVTQKSVPTAPVGAGSLVAPVPVIVGSPAIGLRLAVRPGAWTAGTRFTYQWLAAGIPIAGATGSALTLATAMLGKRITVRVTGTHVGYVTATRSSIPTVAVGRPLKTATPTITGTAAVTKVLTAKPGIWTTGTAFSYRWFADGVMIAIAKSSTLRLSAAQLGKAITVRVTGSKAGYATATRTSPATARVAPDPNRGKSRTSPYAANTSFTLGSWALRLGHTVTNAWPLIQLENMFNDAPYPGWSYVMVPVTFTRLGSTPEQPWWDTRLNFIGSDGVAYSNLENSQSCGVLPNAAMNIGDMYRGATATGNMCAVVPTSVIAGGVWRAETDVWNVYRYVGQ
jgi:hypothetical protein